MTTQPVLNATARDRGGKGAARQARRDGLVPGVIYGGKQPAQMVSFNAREFGLFFNRTPDLASTVIEVKLDGESIRVLARDVQLHPVTDVPLHVDLLRLTGDHEIRVEVAVHKCNLRHRILHARSEASEAAPCVPQRLQQTCSAHAVYSNAERPRRGAGAPVRASW